MGKRFILGLGNHLRCDDAIGLHVIDHIVDNGMVDGFEALAIGNDGFRALTFFEETTERIVVVDCALIGKLPGEYVVVRPEDVRSRKIVGDTSTHEGDMLRIIELARLAGNVIPEIRLLTIQPETTEEGTGLSPVLRKHVESYAATAVREVSGPTF